MNVLEASGLRFEYTRGTPVLDGVSIVRPRDDWSRCSGRTGRARRRCSGA